MRKVNILLLRRAEHDKALTTTLTPYSIFRVGGESGRWSMEVVIPFSTLPLQPEQAFVGCPLSFVRESGDKALAGCPRIFTNHTNFSLIR